MINIVSAFYGRKSAAYCPNGDVSDTNCYANATRYAKFYAQGKNTGIAQASSAEFGDPCPGIAKYLEIGYECKNPGIGFTKCFYLFIYRDVYIINIP